MLSLCQVTLQRDFRKCADVISDMRSTPSQLCCCCYLLLQLTGVFLVYGHNHGDPHIIGSLARYYLKLFLKSGLHATQDFAYFSQLLAHFGRAP